METSAEPTASEAGFSVSIETPYDGLPKWQWMPRAAIRGLFLSGLGLFGGYSFSGPSSTVVVRRNASVYRRFAIDNLDMAVRLAEAIDEELRTYTADEFLRRRPSVAKW